MFMLAYERLKDIQILNTGIVGSGIIGKNIR